MPLVHKAFAHGQAGSIAGVDNPGIARRLAGDVAHSLSTFEDDDDESRAQKFSAALEIVKMLEPRDALEAQLIVQIVCTHTIATEAMRRANREGQSEDHYYKTLRLAGKFMSLFQEQMRTLTKYRASPAYKASLGPKSWSSNSSIPSMMPMARSCGKTRFQRTSYGVGDFDERGTALRRQDPCRHALPGACD